MYSVYKIFVTEFILSQVAWQSLANINKNEDGIMKIVHSQLGYNGVTLTVGP